MVKSKNEKGECIGDVLAYIASDRKGKVTTRLPDRALLRAEHIFEFVIIKSFSSRSIQMMEKQPSLGPTPHPSII